MRLRVPVGEDSLPFVEPQKSKKPRGGMCASTEALRWASKCRRPPRSRFLVASAAQDRRLTQPLLLLVASVG